MAELTDKQQRFCEEYLVDLNATQAAIRAGYSENTAPEQGSRLLINVKVQNKIQELQQTRSERTKITADMVLQELGKVGFSNIQDFLNSDLTVKDLQSLEKEKAQAIHSIKRSVTEFEGGTKEVVEFKMHDKLRALEMIGRHIGFFEKDNDQSKTPIIIPDIKVYTGAPPLSNTEKEVDL